MTTKMTKFGQHLETKDASMRKDRCRGRNLRKRMEIERKGRQKRGDKRSNNMR